MCVDAKLLFASASNSYKRLMINFTKSVFVVVLVLVVVVVVNLKYSVFQKRRPLAPFHYFEYLHRNILHIN